jgi:hypothetical protein
VVQATVAPVLLELPLLEPLLLPEVLLSPTLLPEPMEPLPSLPPGLSLLQADRRLAAARIRPGRARAQTTAL